MKFSHSFIVFLAISMAFTPSIEAVGVRWHATRLGRIVGKSARTVFGLPLLKIKAGLLLAPIALPIAAAKGALALGTIGTSAAIGSAIGAPVGALIGAKAGALKGALVGKALVATKIALAKKAAVAAAAIALKPVVIGAALKAKLLAAKLALKGKAIGLVGRGVAWKGRALTHVGERIALLSHSIHGIGAAAKAKLIAAIALPKLPVLAIKKKYYGPSYFDGKYSLNTPITGYKYGHAFISGNRKKRDTEELPESEESPEILARQNEEGEPMEGESSEQVEVVETKEAKEPPKIVELISFVQSRDAQACLKRVICELSADPNIYGMEGIKFGSSLLAMSRTTSSSHPGTVQFRSASTVGSSSRDPSICVSQFPECSTPSNEVIRIGNTLITG